MEYDGLSDVLELSALPDPSEKFVLEGLIAEGAYGAVYEASDRWKSSVRVAVKVVAHISRHVTEIEQEYRTLSELSGHAHFPEFYGVFLKKPSPDPGTHEIWFAMELAQLGSVGELSRRCQRRCQNLPEDLIAYILASAVKVWSCAGS
ncbi:Serine-threonine/tyrosine-protein kinase catalytic domain, partial [Trinorchestia longiramus]